MTGKRIFCALFAALVLAGCTAARADTPAPKTELTVFAAASLTESLTRIANEYRQTNPDVRLGFNFDSSGTLKTQIEEGAAADLFFSAAQKQMDELEEKGFIAPDSRTDLLENRVVLAVPAGNPKQIQSLDDLAGKLKAQIVLLGIGNEDVPVGQYTKKILAALGLREADLARAGVLTYGSNVKEVTTQVTEASVDAGLIYATDARSAGLPVIDEADVKSTGPIVYPAAVLAGSRQKAPAEDFLLYLRSETAAAIFASAGFSGTR